MFYKKLLPDRLSKSIIAARNTSAVSWPLQGPSIFMSTEEFSAFMRTEVRANDFTSRTDFVQNLVTRAQRIFTEEQALYSILSYFNEIPDQNSEIIPCVLHRIRKHPTSLIHRIQVAYQEKLTVSPSTNRLKLFDEVLSQMNITRGDLLASFWRTVEVALREEKRQKDKLGKMVLDYTTSLRELTAQITTHLPRSSRVKVIGLLGDMEFLLSTYMGTAENQDIGYIYLSRLTMMEQDEYTRHLADLREATSEERHKVISDTNLRNVTAYTYLYRIAEEGGEEEGIFMDAIHDTRQFMFDHDISPEDDQIHIAQYFLTSFTQRLGTLIAGDPQARRIFQDIYTRLIEPHVKDHDFILFTDTGFKGTLPALSFALVKIFGTKEAGIYLSSVRHDLSDIIPSFFHERPGNGKRRLGSKGICTKLEAKTTKMHELVIGSDPKNISISITPGRYLKSFNDMYHLMANGKK